MKGLQVLLIVVAFHEHHTHVEMYKLHELILSRYPIDFKQVLKAKRRPIIPNLRRRQVPANLDDIRSKAGACTQCIPQSLLYHSIGAL